MDRRAELERKRAQLAELRAKKAQRDPSVPPSAVPSSSVSEVKHLDPEDILKQLGISRPEASSPAKRSSIVINDGISVTQQVETETRRVPKLTLVTLPAASIAPKEPVTYDKGIQTTTSGGSGSESNDNRNMIDYYGKFDIVLKFPFPFIICLTFDWPNKISHLPNCRVG